MKRVLLNRQYSFILISYYSYVDCPVYGVLSSENNRLRFVPLYGRAGSPLAEPKREIGIAGESIRQSPVNKVIHDPSRIHEGSMIGGQSAAGAPVEFAVRGRFPFGLLHPHANRPLKEVKVINLAA